jgi:LysM repeat protein
MRVVQTCVQAKLKRDITSKTGDNLGIIASRNEVSVADLKNGMD